MDILEIKREFLEMKEKTDSIRRSLWLRKEKNYYKRFRKTNFLKMVSGLIKEKVQKLLKIWILKRI